MSKERSDIEKEKIATIIRLIKLQLDKIAEDLYLLTDEHWWDDFFEDLKK